MHTRRMALKTFGMFPAAVISDKPGEKTELVVPEAAAARFADVIAKGCKITGITIHYSRTAKPGYVSRGQAFLFTPAECDWKLK